MRFPWIGTIVGFLMGMFAYVFHVPVLMAVIAAALVTIGVLLVRDWAVENFGNRQQ